MDRKTAFDIACEIHEEALMLGYTPSTKDGVLIGMYKVLDIRHGIIVSLSKFTNEESFRVFVYTSYPSHFFGGR